MNKLFKKIIVLIFTLLMLISSTSCSLTTSNEAVKQGKLCMARGDYQTALGYMQLAKSEGSRNKSVSEIILILDSYIKAKNAYDTDNLPDAKKNIELIPISYENYAIKTDVENLLFMIESKQRGAESIDSQINETRKFIAAGDYGNANAYITDLYEKELTQEQREAVNELYNTVRTAENRIQDAAQSEPDIIYIVPEGNGNTSSSSSSNTNVVATYYVVNCDSYITLRTSPTTSASALTTIPLGKAVGYIENAGNGFCKINYDGAVGYALSSYLSATKPTVAATRAKVVNAQEFITLRSYPSTEASELTKIPANSYVTYLGEAGNGFYKISYNGMVGYGLQSYLLIVR